MTCKWGTFTESYAPTPPLSKFNKKLTFEDVIFTYAFAPRRSARECCDSRAYYIVRIHFLCHISHYTYTFHISYYMHLAKVQASIMIWNMTCISTMYYEILKRQSDKFECNSIFWFLKCISTMYYEILKHQPDKFESKWVLWLFVTKDSLARLFVIFVIWNMKMYVYCVIWIPQKSAYHWALHFHLLKVQESTHVYIWYILHLHLHLALCHQRTLALALTHSHILYIIWYIKSHILYMIKPLALCHVHFVAWAHLHLP